MTLYYDSITYIYTFIKIAIISPPQAWSTSSEIPSGKINSCKVVQ